MRKFEGSSVTQILNCSNRAQNWQVASVAQKTQFQHFSQSYDYFRNLNLAIFESWNFALNKSSLFIHYQYWMVKMVLSMLGTNVYYWIIGFEAIYRVRTLIFTSKMLIFRHDFSTNWASSRHVSVWWFSSGLNQVLTVSIDIWSYQNATSDICGYQR